MALLLTCYILDSFFFKHWRLLGRCIRTKKVSFIRLAKASVVSCLLSECEDLSSDPESSQSQVLLEACAVPPPYREVGGRARRFPGSVWDSQPAVC